MKQSDFLVGYEFEFIARDAGRSYLHQTDTTFEKVDEMWVDSLHQGFDMTQSDRAIIQEIMRSRHRNSKKKFDEYDDYDLSRVMGNGLFVVLLRLMPIYGFYKFHSDPRTSHHWLSVNSDAYDNVTEYYCDLIRNIDLKSKHKVKKLAKEIGNLYIREVNSNSRYDEDNKRPVIGLDEVTRDRLAFQMSRYMGFKIKPMDNDEHRNIGKTKPGWYLKPEYLDGSILYDASLELITPPLRPREGKKHLSKVLQMIREKGYETHETTGVHVNVSRDGMTDEEYSPSFLSLGMDHLAWIKEFGRTVGTESTPKERMRDAIAEILGNNILDIKTIKNDFPTFIRILDGYMGNFHGKIAEFDKWQKHKYIEFRAGGGLDYPDNEALIVDYTDACIDLLGRCADWKSNRAFKRIVMDEVNDIRERLLNKGKIPVRRQPLATHNLPKWVYAHP